MKLLIRVVAFVLAIVILFMAPVRVHATGAVGGIISGGGAIIGGLTAGQVAILLLGAFGVYYAAENSDAIGDSLEYVFEAEVSNAQLSAEQSAQYAAALAEWWESAKAGAIDLASAPAWIVDAVKDWAGGFISGDSSVIATSALSVFSVPARSFWYDNNGNAMSWTLPSVCMAYQSSASVTGVSLYFAFTEPNVIPKIINTYGNVVSVHVSDYLVDGNTYYTYVCVHASAQYTAQVRPTGIDNLAYAMISGTYVGDLTDVEVYPDTIAGGIAEEIKKGTDMDVIGLPNIVIPGPDVLPVSPSEGQTDADAITDYLMAALISGEITWEQYWELIGVYNPAIGTSAPTISKTDTETGTITNTEISTGTTVTPSEISDYSLDLTQFFPFCLPFDIYAFFELLAADPEAPHLEFDIEFPYMKEPWHLVIDLSAWDDTALLLRRLELLAFIIGLCVFTREKFLRS